MFKLPEEVDEGLKRYRESLEESREGKISPARFKGIRVPWGVYSHRGGKPYMVRVRVPAGWITAPQIKALAIASERYGDGVLHITTRQDIQIHNVKIGDTAEVMDYLKHFDLSPRGGGGNTVRNVIACPYAGVCREELFDVTGYALAVTEYLLSQEDSFNLPRKLKIAFSGCSKDCVGGLVNDLGFFAARKDNVKGFKVFIGGGMGADSRVGRLLEEFIPEDETGFCITAVKNVFYKKGERKNRYHNRLRFLIEDIGLEEFRGFYREELESLRETKHIILRKIDLPGMDTEEEGIPKAGNARYRDFLEYSVRPQKQKGFLSVGLRIPRGDISSKTLLKLAGLKKDFPTVGFRTSQNQNLILSWVRDRELYLLFSKLNDILDEFLYPDTLLDVVACKGASTCNLGLCNTPGLAKELEGLIRKEFIGKKVFRYLDIKLNGCPNACGHQPIGKLSFYGLARKVNNRAVPFYRFHLGGRKEMERTKLAEEAAVIPARAVPGFLKEFLKKSENKIRDGRDAYGFLDNDAKDLVREIMEKYSYIPSYSEDKAFYIDWGKEKEFSLAGLGPGECGAGIIDMIESDLNAAKAALEGSGRNNLDTALIKSALFYSARALLVTRGSDPKSEKDVFDSLKERFIKEGIVSPVYNDIGAIYAGVKEKVDPDERNKIFIYAKDFSEHINRIYENMDSSFNFPGEKVAPVQGGEKKRQGTSNVLDLKGTPCPINYVKAKLFLEGLDSGDELEIFLDRGEPIENVPRSLRDDGHQILKIEDRSKFYSVLVKKK